MDLNNFCGKIDDWYLYYFLNTTYHVKLYNFMCLIWVVGILGNLVNVVVFRHENMVHPINLIFWWLSISDLLELVILAWREYYCELCLGIQIINYYFYGNSIYECVLNFVINYLIQVVHTITVGLNIILIFCQYIVVAHPLINRKNSFNDRSIKVTVIWMYISTFVSYLPLWLMYEIQPLSHGWHHYQWLIYLKGSDNPNSTHNEPQSGYISQDPLVDIGIVVYGIVLRIGLLIILIILCTLLLFAMKSQHRNRQVLGLEAHHLSKGQKKLNRMSVTVVVVIIMFFITEVPIAISSFSLFWSSYLFKCREVINHIIMFPCILLNCSFSIFCYLIRIKEYRKTLVLLLSKSKNWVCSRTRVVEQTDFELHPL